MTPRETVEEVLSLRFKDIGRIVARRVRKRDDDELVEFIVGKVLLKCLRLADKFDPARGDVWKWVMMVTWSEVQRATKTKRWPTGGKVKVDVVKEDAMNHLKGVREGEIEVDVENVPERPHWPVGAEEDALITAIDIKAGKYEIS